MANLPFNVDEVVVEKVKDDKKRLANSKRQYLANRGRDPTMQFKRLSEIAISVQYGYTAQETSQQGVYKYLRITDIVPYYPNFETVPYCAIDNDEAQKYLLSEGDIVIARTGATTGYNFVVTKKIPPTVFASYLIRFRVDETQAYPKYIKYVLKSKPYYGFVANYVGGSAQPGMGAKVFARFPVPLHPLPTQRAIAEKLGRYDALIENNTRRIAILERKAEQLYKEWFVRRRFPGHGAGGSENLTQMRRDAEVQRSEIGRAASMMPPEWKVERLGNLADISTGKCNREDAEEDGVYPLFDRSQETKRSNEWIKDCEAIIVPGEGTSFMPRYYKGKFNLHQRCYCVEPRMKNTGKYLFYAIMLNRRYFLSVATGATVPSLRQNNFLSMKILWPHIELVAKFDKYATRIFALKDNLQRQNALLAKERDLLLPRLMSGRVKL